MLTLITPPRHCQLCRDRLYSRFKHPNIGMWSCHVMSLYGHVTHVLNTRIFGCGHVTWCPYMVMLLTLNTRIWSWGCTRWSGWPCRCSRRSRTSSAATGAWPGGTSLSGGRSSWRGLRATNLVQGCNLVTVTRSNKATQGKNQFVKICHAFNSHKQIHQ